MKKLALRLAAAVALVAGLALTPAPRAVAEDPCDRCFDQCIAAGYYPSHCLHVDCAHVCL